MELLTDYHFSTCIHRNKNESFISDLNVVHNDYVKRIENNHGVSGLYPMILSEAYSEDERVQHFKKFVEEMALQAFTAQGYDDTVFDTVVTEMFSQEHRYSSNMEPHFHNTFFSGFYFLEVPDEDIRALFYDPKDVKVFMSAKEKNPNMLTPATSLINYNPEPGLLMLTNSWLRHSFTRNPSKLPFKFVHLGIGVVYNPNKISSCKQPIIV